MVCEAGERLFLHTFVPRGAKVIRGGSHATPKHSVLGMHPVLGRWGLNPRTRLPYVGFRVALSLPRTPATGSILDLAVANVKGRWKDRNRADAPLTREKIKEP